MSGPGAGAWRDAADERWSRAFPRLTRSGAHQWHRSLLEQAEAAYQTSAALLRRSGRTDVARRADRFAAWARFSLDEPAEARRLSWVAKSLHDASRPGSLFDAVLDGALWLLGANLGNVQLTDPTSGALRIVAQRGFGADFLEHFAVVDDRGSACGRAAMRHAQTVIEDVRSDPGFAPHREIAAAAGFRAVQSTPLLGPDGGVVGVVSTHYARPGGPADSDLRLIQHYAELAGQAIADRLSPRPR